MATKTDAPAAVPLVGKKFMNALGGMVNDAASSGVSAFARRQMEKMGWKDGKGLGKEEQGMVSHVKVKKREEFMGVGVEKVKVEETKNQWWYNAYDRIAHKIQIDASSEDEDDADASAKKAKKKAKKELKKKRKREAEAEDGGAEMKFRIPTDEELFKATGGKLFGRRAYGSCTGKLKRDELHMAGKLKSKKEMKAKKEEDTTSGENDEAESEDEQKKAKKSKKAKKQKKRKSETQEDDDEE